MATNNLLTQPTPHYHKFVDNQVLTDDQLNSMLDYLNHQDRLSRMLLHGVGIVCGLDISLDESRREFHLTDGVAVTTAGDLLKPGSKIFKGFKAFKDTNVKYSFFTDSEGATIDLWELETDTSPSDVRPLSQFESNTDISINKAVAVLYLEDYLGEEEDCSPVDCDTQGQPVINQLRVLLVSPVNAQKIGEQDSIFSNLLKGGSQPFIQDLAKVYVPRVMLNSSNTASFDQFKKAYEISFRTLAGEISKLGSISVFKDLFDKEGIDPTSELQSIASSSLNYQYVYDFYKDLSDAFNEVRSLLRENYALCCPDPSAFPKHVLLGGNNLKKKVWRHPFYPSPTHIGSAVGKMNSAFLRILNMIKSFHSDNKNEIRITPSRDDDFRLGERAVPFYYNLEKAEEAAIFLQNWKEKEIELVPNYFGTEYPAGGFDPLNVHLDDHDFYRIEGHNGNNITDAHKKIKEIQENRSLSFDIQQVAIGEYPDESTIDYDKYRVYFEDLQVVLQAWNEEQQCLMKTASDFLTKFSTKDPGRHIAYLPELETDAHVTADSEFMETETPKKVEAIDYMYGKSYTGKTKRARENQVMNSISDEKDTLGHAMLDVVKITDNKNDFWVKTNNVLLEKVVNWDKDIKTATIDIPAQLLGYLKETEDYKLTEIEDFTEENLRKYLESLKAQCQKTSDSKKKLQSLIQKEGSVLRTKEWTENYQYVLNRISSSCCIIEKVKVLYEKIIERKKEVLDKFVLDTYIKDHPGAEHKAGVEKGGTFILLYFSKNSKNRVDRELRFKNPEMRLEPGMPKNAVPDFKLRREIGGTTHFSDIRDDRGSIRESDREAMFNLSAIRGKKGTLLRENIPHGTVIGDLSLPYRCCSGSPSTSFIFPEQLATLRIPVDHVCVDENGNTDPIPLSVSPVDGTVKAFIQKKELLNVIREEENGTFFNPDNVPVAEYGKPIRFEVNGQPVEPVLEVNRKPIPKFTFNERINFKEENTIAVVTFKNGSEPFDELKFEWDFNGETVSNENAIEFTHLFNVKPGENFDFNVTLTAFSGSCQNTFSDSVTIDVPELDIPDEPDEPDQPDNPDQPDRPDQPDNPDQPERDCVNTSTRAIKASFNIIEREVREHSRQIDRRFLSFYSESINPIYVAILDDPQSALNGELDDKVESLVRESQKRVIESIGTQNTPIQREFMLKIYYEMALLYFYINSCRSSEITSEIAIHDRRNNWLTFTEQSVERFPEAMQILLEADKIHSKFEIILDRMGRRLDRTLNSFIEKMISIFSEISNGR